LTLVAQYWLDQITDSSVIYIRIESCFTIKLKHIALTKAAGIYNCVSDTSLKGIKSHALTLSDVNRQVERK